MKYLLLVSHATLCEGLAASLGMLLGPRPYVITCGMEEGTAPTDFASQLDASLQPVGADDEVVVLGDIAGGYPLKAAVAALANKGADVRAFGGTNLPMAIAAVMGIDDGLDLDAVRDALLIDGAQAVREA